jgi:folate-binding protein YgfZ
MNPHEQLATLHRHVGAVDRTDRAVVTVTGPEAVSFLQALVSADLDPLTTGATTESLLLSPQGKLDVAFRLVLVAGDPDEQEVWLDADPGLGPQLAASLDRFRIRVQAEVADRSDDLGVVSLIGPDAPAAVGAGPGVHVVATAHGLDVIGSTHDLQTIAARFERIEPDVYEAWRIEQGIPLQPFDVDASTIPQEAELEFDAVSFTKGCFLGQELVCRIDSRGHVNRFLRRVVDVDGVWPTRGAEVVAGGKVVGALTSVAPATLPTGALGYVRREIEPPAAVELRSDNGNARATVVERRPPPG